jgi:outer membrane biosynthesis protein TonB
LAQIPQKPAEVISAPDIQYPILSVASGVVVLDVSLDVKGSVTGSTVVRDIPSLTSVAASSVQSWTFIPAARQGRPEPSVMRIAFAFRPRAYPAADPNFAPILSNRDANQQVQNQAYVVPGIVSASYPGYPLNSAAPGAVVIQVTVSKSGTIERLNVVRDLHPFTDFALSAAKKWRFLAATLEGKPTTSNLAIAFVFAPLPSHK